MESDSKHVRATSVLLTEYQIDYAKEYSAKDTLCSRPNVGSVSHGIRKIIDEHIEGGDNV